MGQHSFARIESATFHLPADVLSWANVDMAVERKLREWTSGVKRTTALFMLFSFEGNTLGSSEHIPGKWTVVGSTRNRDVEF